MIAVGKVPDVLGMDEAFALCSAHVRLGLTTDAVGRLVLDESYDPAELKAEMTAIAERGDPNVVEPARRVLAALESDR